MKVIVSAGGTGGHLYPALALVDYIKKIDETSEFLFVGTTDRIESRIVPEKNIPYVGLKVKGLVGNPFQKFRNLCLFVKSMLKSYRILKDFKPDIVIGFGGYPSASIVFVASKMGFKTMIHEQNSIIGLTNKILIQSVDEIICCYEKAFENFPKEKTKLLGNPRAQAVLTHNIQDIHDIYHIPLHRKVVLIVMGSLGSSSINQMMKEVFDKVQGEKYDIVFATGHEHFDEMKDVSYDNIHIVPYIEDMPSCLTTCDLVVTRAGATTLSEITAIGVASIIVPSPYVTSNHQEYNAKELEDKGAALMILEKDFQTENFLFALNDVMSHDEKREALKQNSYKLGKRHALDNIYQEMLKVMRES